MIYMTGTVAIICDICLIYWSIKEEENIPVAMFWIVMLLAVILAMAS